MFLPVVYVSFEQKLQLTVNFKKTVIINFSKNYHSFRDMQFRAKVTVTVVSRVEIRREDRTLLGISGPSAIYHF